MMADSNRAVVYVGERKIEIQERPIPDIGDNEVLVKVFSTGICGSDVHTYCDGNTHKGLVLGHESAGQITAVGKNIKTRHVGQRVAIEPGFVCGRCEFCRKGRSNVCANIIYASLGQTDGTMSQWFACEPNMAVPFPDSVSWEEAGCIQPLAVGVQLMRQADMRPHQTVAVFGCGPLGLMIMGLAKAYGASKILAFDVDPARVAFAESYCGAIGVVPPKNDKGKDTLEFLKDFIGPLLSGNGLGSGVDLAIDASGAEICMQMAVVIAKPHGTFLQAGLGKQLCSIPIWLITVKCLTVKGTVRYGPGCFEDAIDLLSRRQIDVKSLVTKTYPLTKAVEALEAQHAKEGIKLIIMNQD